MDKAVKLTRRQLLQGAAGLPLAAQLGLLQAALAEQGTARSAGDYKSLVCLFQFGGNDAFNSVVPLADVEFARYQNARGPMALARDILQPLAGSAYGFHPSLSRLRELYDNGRLGVVANVGNMIEPVTKLGLRNDTVRVPVGLFSHSHQQQVWQTGHDPDPSVAHSGWGGRLIDTVSLRTANTAARLAPAMSMDGANAWQAAPQSAPFYMDPVAENLAYNYLDEAGWQHSQQRRASRAEAWNAILNLSSPHPMQRQLQTAFAVTRASTDAINQALSLSRDAVPNDYNPNNFLALKLRMAARMIYAREQLGVKRQIFFIASGGWDTHGDQLQLHSNLLASLDEALASFQQTLDTWGIADSVTTFTASEFGRSLTANGDGTDHGWSGHHFVLGGSVKGGMIHGRMPSLQLGGPDDAGDDANPGYLGRIMPEYAVDQFGASMARWLGAGETELSGIFPNLANFSTADLDFMRT